MALHSIKLKDYKLNRQEKETRKCDGLNNGKGNNEAGNSCLKCSIKTNI